MTLLREIQDAATGADVAVSVVLRKAQILAARLDHEPLRQWTKLELDGYRRAEDLPDYRRLGKVLVLGHFAGPFGSGMRNAPISAANVPREWREMLFTHRVFEPVAEVDALSKSADGGVQYAWPTEATAAFAQRFYEDQVCMQAFKVVSTTAFVSVLDTVRVKSRDVV